MFSVPGWNLSARIAIQVEKAKPKDPNKLGKKAQKRKEKQEQEVTADNVGDLWAKVVDRKDAKTGAVGQNDVEHTGDGAQEQRGKKRKRGKSSNNKQEDADGTGEAQKLSPAVDPELQPVTAVPTASKPSTAASESKRDKKKRKKEQKDQKSKTSTTATTPTLPPLPDFTALLPTPSKLTPLQKSMRQKLASARFRHLNESLYTKPSAASLSLFQDDPSMFEDYHRGFAQQVEVWPSNPVDGYVDAILSRGKLSPTPTKPSGKPKHAAPKPLPRSPRPPYTTTIADLGCGTASLSYRLQPHLPALNLTLHSYDLARPPGPSGPLVSVADISALPLPAASVDVAIFCLALMGTNWLDFIDEAYRILRWKGELWVAEIKSRFGRVERKNSVPVNSVGSLKKGKKKIEEQGDAPRDPDDEALLEKYVDGKEGAAQGTDVSAFVAVMLRRGFVLDAPSEAHDAAIDLSNKMFVKMQFVKGAAPTRGKNVKGSGGKEEGRGLKYGLKGKKYDAVGEEDGDEEVEKKVLKPCLYKVR